MPIIADNFFISICCKKGSPIHKWTGLPFFENRYFFTIVVVGV